MDLKHSSAQIDAIRNHILEDKEPCRTACFPVNMIALQNSSMLLPLLALHVLLLLIFKRILAKEEWMVGKAHCFLATERNRLSNNYCCQ
jgi:hypothetical protein